MLAGLIDKERQPTHGPGSQTNSYFFAETLTLSMGIDMNTTIPQFPKEVPVLQLTDETEETNSQIISLNNRVGFIHPSDDAWVSMGPMG